MKRGACIAVSVAGVDVDRISWDEYFLKLALVTAERSTCKRHHVGTIIVKDKHVLTGGYNGAPSGMEDCLELGCLRDAQNIPSGERTEICRAVHSEENAIIQAAVHGINIAGSTVYSTHTPCRRCAKMLCNAKILAFVACGRYNEYVFEDLFNVAGISLTILARPSLFIEELK